jgi:hypothetical protein
MNETWEKLDSVEVKFLPSNTTTELQPCDAGIIHSFKCHYKHLFIQNQINAYGNMQDGIVEKLKIIQFIMLYKMQLKLSLRYHLKQSQIAGKKTGILSPNNEIDEIYEDQDLVISNRYSTIKFMHMNFINSINVINVHNKF